MSFDQTQIDSLVKKLPSLCFDPNVDSVWLNDQDVQSYLDFYKLRFQSEFPNLRHGFGAINALGFRVATHYWLPENAKGTLLIMHGYYDHTGLFANAIRLGLEQNFAVLMFDLPGHGLSDGEKISIDSFDDYGDVLNSILLFSHKHLPQPFFGWGQSTGGAILLNHLWRYENVRQSPINFSKRILFAPLILPRDWKKGRRLYWLIHKFIKRIPRKPSENSHDKNFLYFVDHLDPLQTHYLSVSWVGAMKAWNEQCRQFPILDNQLLIVQGSGDRTVDWKYNLQELKRLLPNAKIEMIGDAGHQLINEIPEYRQAAFAKVVDYLSSP
jgi:alpha-beta hydrolase superfamily lysophospholipase